ncbi:MAG: type II toxin-antitoxin system VapC family toxin [Armatimonadetes bacterium]|nr:type II toxin-antitoxin system VapC family toxin [Armatimonadota bacterium]
MTYLLDTSTVSLLLRGERNPEVIERHAEAEAAGAEFVLCPVVAYEVRRGLAHREAHRQRADFGAIEQAWAWDDLQWEDWHKAAELWARQAAVDAPRADADLLIAAHALRLGAVVVTDNVRHFEGLGVQVESWRGAGRPYPVRH